MAQPTQEIDLFQFRKGRLNRVSSHVIVEKAVSLTINGYTWLEFMCTPIDLEEMAIGFIYNEGLISSIDDIVSVHLCKGGENIDIWLKFGVESPSIWKRTSGCTGGVTSVESEHVFKDGILDYQFDDENLSTPHEINHLIMKLIQAQNVYRKSGGVHTSALSDGTNLLFIAEDIGRHNTLDKIAGKYLKTDLNLNNIILLTTGRISSEMLQKSARIGASTVISRTSPSSISVELAKLWGITLIGYARRDQFKIYTHPERIKTNNSDKIYSSKKTEREDLY
jgi:FdhD protein